MLQKYAAKDNAVFSFKRTQNIQVYVHRKGEEFWLTGTNSFPSEIGTFVLQVPVLLQFVLRIEINVGRRLFLSLF
jgi:hypothetical protein